MRTSVPGIYAAGDVLARFMLSSMAVMEARIAAENALGLDVRMDYSCAPWGIYTDPEVGSVGQTEEWARAGGGEIVIGQCGYNDLVRSCLDGNVTGFFKLIFDAATRRLVGAHVAGPGRLGDHPLRRAGGQARRPGRGHQGHGLQPPDGLRGLRQGRRGRPEEARQVIKP